MIVYRRKFIRVAESWSGEETEAPAVDLVRYYQRAGPLVDAHCRTYHTLTVDLTQGEDLLSRAVKPKTRGEIRRAGGERLRCEWWPGDRAPMLEGFSEDYDRFADRKGLPRLDRSWWAAMARSGRLVLAQVADESGRPLVWHAYHRDRGRATLLRSASSFRESRDSAYRNFVGRANRYFHWLDLLHFKAFGDVLYDFGGWYPGSEDVQRLGINRFKEEFGGRVVVTYLCERPLTWRGKLFLGTRRWLLGDSL